MCYRCEGEGIINYHVTIGVLYNDGVSFTVIMMWSGKIPVGRYLSNTRAVGSAAATTEYPGSQGGKPDTASRRAMSPFFHQYGPSGTLLGWPPLWQFHTGCFFQNGRRHKWRK